MPRTHAIQHIIRRMRPAIWLFRCFFFLLSKILQLSSTLCRCPSISVVSSFSNSLLVCLSLSHFFLLFASQCLVRAIFTAVWCINLTEGNAKIIGNIQRRTKQIRNVNEARRHRSMFYGNTVYYISYMYAALICAVCYQLVDCTRLRAIG